MKRLTFLLAALALLLAGCGPSQERSQESVAFYYLRENLDYGNRDSVIVPETREAAGQRRELSYILALYQVGPSEEGLRSPLPEDVRIQSVQVSGRRISLALSDASEDMTDLQFTLACACLSMTSLELVDADAVVITGGSRTITMDRDSLVLYDQITNTAVEETK